MTTIISYYTILATLVVVWCSDHTGAIPLAITTGPHQGEHHITKTSSLLPVATTTTTTTQHNTSYLIGLVQHHLNSLLDSVRQVVNDTQQSSTSCFINHLAQNDTVNVSVQLQQDLLSLVRFESVVSYIITTQYHNQTQQLDALSNIEHNIHTTSLPMTMLRHQLTPNSVDTTPPNDDAQCWQYLNVTHTLQSLITQVDITQRHLLSLLRGNITLIAAYFAEAKLHTYHIIQLQSVVSTLMNISSQTQLNGCYVSTTDLPVNIRLRADLKSLYLLNIAVARVISTQPANQITLRGELNKLRKDIIKAATALSHLIDILSQPSEPLQVPMPKYGEQCDQLTNEQIIQTIKVQAIITAQDLDTLNKVYMNNI